MTSVLRQKEESDLCCRYIYAYMHMYLSC